MCPPALLLPEGTVRFHRNNRRDHARSRCKPHLVVPSTWSQGSCGLAIELYGMVTAARMALDGCPCRRQSYGGIPLRIALRTGATLHGRRVRRLRTQMGECANLGLRPKTSLSFWPRTGSQMPEADSSTSLFCAPSWNTVGSAQLGSALQIQTAHLSLGHYAFKTVFYFSEDYAGSQPSFNCLFAQRPNHHNIIQFSIVRLTVMSSTGLTLANPSPLKNVSTAPAAGAQP